MKEKLTHSWATFLIFGFVPFLLLALGIYRTALYGGIKNQQTILFPLAIIVFLLMWNRGTYVILDGERFVYRRFFLLKSEIHRSDISRCKAFTSFDLSLGSPPPFCLDIFADNPKKPAIRINLKPFSKTAIARMFEWLPNMDSSKFRFSVLKRK